MKQLLERLEKEILKTPTGELRELLTDVSIAIRQQVLVNGQKAYTFDEYKELEHVKLGYKTHSEICESYVKYLSMRGLDCEPPIQS